MVSGHLETAPSALDSKQAWSWHGAMRRARGALRFVVGGAVAGVMTVPGVVLLTPTTAAAIPGGDITEVCTGETSPDGTTFTLNADCGPVETELTVPPDITTINGGGFTISAMDPTVAPFQWTGGIVTNETAGQTMNIQNVTIAGPEDGFVLSTNSNFVVYGIWFDDAGGSVSDVIVEHIWQQPTPQARPTRLAGPSGPTP
jgi:hypothetical protein